MDESSGRIIVCFDRDKCSLQGDLMAYMNQFDFDSLTVKEFSLRRDARKWGAIEPNTKSVTFAFVPPWGKYKPTIPVQSVHCHKQRQKERPVVSLCALGGNYDVA